jgi:hypothetical protein
MIIENSQDTIEFNLPDEFDKIGIKLSGGADSAIVLYMLCKYITETNRECEIIPMTVCHAGKAYQLQFATKVIFFMQEVFPNIKFGIHPTGVNYHGESYDWVQQKVVDSAYRNNQINCHYVGITKNPPSDVMIAFDQNGPADDRNADTVKPTVRGGHVFLPLINIDKQGVRELYEKFDLMDTLFPLTRSCEVFTDDFSKHCETDCWFCLERYWGFGRYE